MSVRLPQYSKKDYSVLMWVMWPFTLLLNAAMFGKMYFSRLEVFVPATLITVVAVSIDFIVCGLVAVALKKRFPHDRQAAKKLTFMILTFWIITLLFLSALFRGYEIISFYGYTFNETAFVYSCITLGIMNVFLTFLMEGIARYENWKKSMLETEQLSKAYNQSRLLGLKSQVSPHFLFNCLNSLSSLISEDEERAEKFLDEMSKVYRYMLRNEEDQLVTLQTELKFIDSYIYLLQVRYGDALKLELDIQEKDKDKCIPPLTLQVIIENVFAQNTVSKHAPLELHISTVHNALEVRCNVQQKIVTHHINHEEGLDNLIKKYKLLNQPPVVITDSGTERRFNVPLIEKQEEVMA
ncbi:MAG: sensor histidine kinase [Agriterribacter sp.]